MVKPDGEQNKEVVVNMEGFGDAFTETHTGGPYAMMFQNNINPHEKRLIFSINERPHVGRYYVFHGVFGIDPTSNMKTRRWIKIADEYVFPKAKN